MVLDLIMGLVSTAGYDFVRKKISDALIKDFSKVYDSSIEELIKTHGKYCKTFVRRFLGKNDVKKIALDYNLDRKKKIERLTIIGEKMKNRRETAINIKKMLEDFYNIFKDELHKNQPLYNKLQERYSSEIIHLLKKQDLKLNKFDSKLVKMYDSQESLKKELFDKLKDESYIKITKDEGSFPLNISAVQFRIDNISINNIKNNINNFPFTSKESMSFLENKENKIILEYMPNKENNVIKLTHEGLPYKIIYPPFNRITIWVENKPKFVQVTIFSTENGQIVRLKHILFGDIDTKKIYEITLRTKMKKLAIKFIRDVSVFDYDPLIYKPFKFEGIEMKPKGKRMIMFGDKGFLLRPELKQIVEKVKIETKEQETDIFFLKIVDTNSLCNEPITLEIGFRGNISGYFQRSIFTKEKAREIICSFLEKNGIPHQFKVKTIVK